MSGDGRCRECGEYLDPEVDDDGYVVDAWCPHERRCCSPVCDARTHESCLGCGEAYCEAHLFGDGECESCTTLRPAAPA